MTDFLEVNFLCKMPNICIALCFWTVSLRLHILSIKGLIDNQKIINRLVRITTPHFKQSDSTAVSLIMLINNCSPVCVCVVTAVLLLAHLNFVL